MILECIYTNIFIQFYTHIYIDWLNFHFLPVKSHEITCFLVDAVVFLQKSTNQSCCSDCSDHLNPAKISPGLSLPDFFFVFFGDICSWTPPFMEQSGRCSAARPTSLEDTPPPNSFLAAGVELDDQADRGCGSSLFVHTGGLRWLG